MMGSVGTPELYQINLKCSHIQRRIPQAGTKRKKIFLITVQNFNLQEILLTVKKDKLKEINIEFMS